MPLWNKHHIEDDFEENAQIQACFESRVCKVYSRLGIHIICRLRVHLFEGRQDEMFCASDSL